MNKKIIITSISIAIVCILVFICVTIATFWSIGNAIDETFSKTSQKETFSEILENEYNNFEIISFKQHTVVDTSLLITMEKTPYYIADVKINDKTHKFVFDEENNKIYSDCNYEKVINEMSEYFKEKLNLPTHLKNENIIHINYKYNYIERLCVLPHNVKSFTDLKDNNDVVVQFRYLYQDVEDLDPRTIAFEKIQSDFPNSEILLLNVVKEKYESYEYDIDTLFDTEDIFMIKDKIEVTFDEKDVFISYLHYKHLPLEDGNTFIYNDIILNADVKCCKGKYLINDSDIREYNSLKLRNTDFYYTIDTVLNDEFKGELKRTYDFKLPNSNKNTTNIQFYSCRNRGLVFHKPDTNRYYAVLEHNPDRFIELSFETENWFSEETFIDNKSFEKVIIYKVSN